MIIAATADVHSPRFFTEFVKALDELKVMPDLFLLAGDMVERGEIEEYDKIQNAFFGKVECPVVACFGNTEFQEQRKTAKENFKSIKFLDDEAVILDIKGRTVGIVGTTGSLDEPTRWQKANITNIEKIYKDRIIVAEKLLMRMRVDVKILLTHYAPTYKTLEGENPNFYRFMGSRAFEKVLLDGKPTLAIHGHSHKGTKMAWVDTVPVYNVAFPLNREIVVIDTEKIKPGIVKFIS